MALHAVSDLTDAFEATRSFLWPIELGKWARLAILSLFVAGSGGGGGGAPGNAAQYTPNGGTGPGTPGMGTGVGPEVSQFVSANLWLIVGIGVVLLALGLVFAWLASVFEFAFVESIRSDTVKVRAYTSRFSGPGTRLFGFRVAFGVIGLVVAGTIALVAVGPFLLGGDPGYLAVLILLIPLFVVGSIVASVIYVFTTAFVVPIMLEEDRGVLSGWGRLWGLIKREWEQFAVFVFVGLLVMIAVGIVVGIAVTALAVVVAIPFMLVAFALVSMGIPLLNLATIAVLGVPYALLFIAIVAVVQVPVQTYLRYWALLVLGDVEESLDLIPEQRAAIRE